VRHTQGPTDPQGGEDGAVGQDPHVEGDEREDVHGHEHHPGARVKVDDDLQV